MPMYDLPHCSVDLQEVVYVSKPTQMDGVLGGQYTNRRPYYFYFYVRLKSNQNTIQIDCGMSPPLVEKIKRKRLFGKDVPGVRHYWDEEDIKKKKEECQKIYDGFMVALIKYKKES